MKYITGLHALNLPCCLNTCGDWHASGIQWDKPDMADTDNSIYGLYGIEFEKQIPGHTETYAVANHIRALLDLLAQGKIPIAQGMKKDYICNDGYTEEIFSRVIKLSGQTDWSRIDKFMHKEYGRQWQLWKYALGTTPDQDECRDVTGLREIYDDNTIIPDADKVVIRECTEYMSHDNITALFNIVFLCIKYFDEISPVTRLFMQETVSNSITEKSNIVWDLRGTDA
jgi:hypothetical protein